MEETVAPEPAPVARTIGERLRAGRERSGLSVAAAAEKLHLDPKVIESLEADRFNELGASVFVRGHLRRYADFVGEPGAELVASYAAKEARPPPPDLTRAPQPERRSDPRRLVTPFVGLACAVVLALAIWWILSGSKPGQPHETVQPTLTAEQVVAASQPATGPEPQPAPAATTPAVEVPTPATTEAPPPRDEATPVRSTRLKLELANDSWVEVYDSRGERLFYDVATAGSVQSVEGRAPLRVVLGNSLGVVIEVDGHRRELPGNATDGEGARFVVNRSGSLSRAR